MRLVTTNRNEIEELLCRMDKAIDEAEARDELKIEHIELDAEELRVAATRLSPAGAVVVLSPAHQWLYTPFDKAIGHFRRYSRTTLAGLSPPGLELVRLRYLDSVGLLASLSNALLLRQAMPTMRQVAFWDRVLVPVSTVVDPLSGYRLGKSVLAVWRRPR